MRVENIFVEKINKVNMSVRTLLTDTNYFRGIGTYKYQNQVRLIYLLDQKELSLQTSQSLDGVNFQNSGGIKLLDSRARRINLQNLTQMRISRQSSQYAVTYLMKKGLIDSLSIGRGKNLQEVRNIASLTQINEIGQIVSDYRYGNDYVMYAGGRGIRILTSPDLKKWRMDKKPLLSANKEGDLVEIGAVEKISHGIMLLYFQSQTYKNEKKFYSIGAIIFDNRDPRKIIYKSKEAIWEQPDEWNNSGMEARPFGIVTWEAKLVSFWELNRREMVAILHEPKPRFQREDKTTPLISLRKMKQNPILKPIIDHFWESKATFNPAAVWDEGKIHIIYRAIGDHDMSMLGYANTKDGVNIEERSTEPIYVPTEPFEYQPQPAGNPIPLSLYASGGGGYGGVEDPRITKIGKKFYMTYVAYDGSRPPRVALTSIEESDFRKKNWKWAKPVLISPPGMVDKNAVIFPEKINGKYVIMHRIYPNILIDYVDCLDFDGKTYLKGDFMITPRRLFWDSRKVGAGAPPIKTDKGWLLIYHAIGEEDPGRYKMGAMLLDIADPTKVLARSFRPILEPEEHYENEGYKYGVAYPCGAVVVDNNLLVYYGGADTVTCVAKAELSSFLGELSYHSIGELKPVTING
ncbi:hypothetical protein A3D78_07010 [Candidatus Gottesmanbacteria bacterium RIFCSPHIGHO2_02_FULL_39_14]|uniref:Glycosidase n=1 Tax=Candidatus Gottesmanbacteria bacterium RIFCSPHIGHO2_02_FULL_39_14 TaxID=1798383 RepID=A0A1F5ZUT9_9BACT|nr:MAG: hypothetical protein A3D78_07010 [Candidatus Gottesmanbacteria bacterium RIFCSPHIGHO2_02_FULL_39_14]